MSCPPADTADSTREPSCIGKATQGKEAQFTCWSLCLDLESLVESATNADGDNTTAEAKGIWRGGEIEQLCLLLLQIRQDDERTKRQPYCGKSIGRFMSAAKAKVVMR